MKEIGGESTDHDNQFTIMATIFQFSIKLRNGKFGTVAIEE